MKQSGASLKILALVTSIALAAGYVAYRVANAKSGDASAASTTAPTVPKEGVGGDALRRIAKPDVGRVPMMGGSKSLAPLIEPKDLDPAPAPEAPAPAAPTPTSPK